MDISRFLPTPLTRLSAILLAAFCVQSLVASNNLGSNSPVDPPSPAPVVLPEPVQALPTFDEFLDLVFNYPTVLPRRQAFHQARTAYLAAQAEGPVAPEVLQALLATGLTYQNAMTQRTEALAAQWLAAGHAQAAIDNLVLSLNAGHL